MIGALVGLGFGSGVALLVVGWWSVRRPSLMLRVEPYVLDVRPESAAWSSTADGSVRRWLQRFTDFVGELASSSARVEQRLDRLGTGLTLGQFRSQQLTWGATSFGVTAAVALLLWSGGSAGTPLLLFVCVLAPIVGVLARDRHLTTQVSRREAHMREELPAVADLLALAVAAGESPVAGLRRVLRVCHGALADELGRVLAAIQTGTQIPQAFDALASRTGAAPVARFAEGIAVAIERGTPLIDVLHAQAADVRESAKRDLIEQGGRKEIAMMIPVVFLIMPTTLVFAFYPAWIGLRLAT